MGDIVIYGEDIHGDGVNVAARLQEASESRGLWIALNEFYALRGLERYDEAKAALAAIHADWPSETVGSIVAVMSGSLE